MKPLFFELGAAKKQYEKKKTLLQIELSNLNMFEHFRDSNKSIDSKEKNLTKDPNPRGFS